MKHRIKIFTGKPFEALEKEVNQWLENEAVEVLEILPSIAVDVAIIPIGTIPGSLGGNLLSPNQAMMQVQAQQIVAFSITVFYKESEKGEK